MRTDLPSLSYSVNVVLSLAAVPSNYSPPGIYDTVGVSKYSVHFFCNECSEVHSMRGTKRDFG
jgi:hypothetical protein